MAVTYGLCSAASWGIADFSGGLATRRNDVFAVVILSQIIAGALLLLVTLTLTEGVPPYSQLIWGGVAGVAGAMGILALYAGLARGRMGIVSSIAAVVTAVIPILFAFFNEGLPPIVKLIGFGFAFVAVWFLTRSEGHTTVKNDEWLFPLLAGIGFGVFFICIDHVSQTAILWPLVAVRITSILTVLCFILTRQKIEWPQVKQMPMIAFIGIGDTAGNVFFAMATRLGRLDISAVVASLYPAVTVLLAWFILKERLIRRQWIGVGATLCALVLIS
jgi:drug/metabolite transporter (DMT)-like permease